MAEARGADDPMDLAVEEKVQPHPAPLPQLDMLHKFGNPLRANNWVRFHNRPIVTGRSVSLEKNNEQRALLVDYLAGLRWDSLVELPEVVYPHAVRLFYNNMTVRHRRSGPVISSYVLGKEIEIDRNYLKMVFEFSDGDSRVYFTSDERLRLAGANIDSDTGLQ